MVHPPREDLRRTLVARVARKVDGSGISRRSIEEAVGRVVSALTAEAPAAGSRAGHPASESSPPAEVPRLAALTARSTPDLASRIRRALSDEGLGDLPLGIASAGQHTVVTLTVPPGKRGAIERVAAALQVQFSIVSAADAAAAGQ